MQAELFSPFVAEDVADVYALDRPSGTIMKESSRATREASGDASSICTLTQAGIVLMIIFAYFTLIRDLFYSKYLSDNELELKRKYERSWKAQLPFAIFITLVCSVIIWLLRRCGGKY